MCVTLSLTHALSLSLSHSNTHTRKYTHYFFFSYPLFLRLTFSLFLLHSLSLSFTFSFSDIFRAKNKQGTSLKASEKKQPLSGKGLVFATIQIISLLRPFDERKAVRNPSEMFEREKRCETWMCPFQRCLFLKQTYVLDI